MNKEEKRYIMCSCYMHLQIALKNEYTDKYKCYSNLGKGRILKKIIEKYIDCQSEPYYSYYLKIVNLANKLAYIGYGKEE